MTNDLGMTKNQLANTFSHCVYDGVYATQEERIKGGGCLSLKKKFALWLGLPEDDFNGCWDLGHNLQLVYADVMKKNPHVEKFNRLMYSFMQDNKFGQSGSRFKEVGDNLLQPILTNKGAQETRWARAELRSIQTFLRNLPVFYNIQAQAIQESSDNFDATGQKEATIKLNQLSDPSMISFAIGMCEILEDYSELSLAGQDL